MKYANVIVDISHSDLDRTFQYKIPETLQGRLMPGMPVRVPFGKSGRRLKGYVIETTDLPEYDEEKLKEVEAVEEKEVSIEGQLIRLALWMKETYGCTMIQALKTVLPARKKVKSRAVRVQQSELPDLQPPEERARLNAEQQSAVDGILQELREANRPSLIYGVTGSGKTEVYMELIAEMMREGKQAILLIPEISLTYQNLRRFYARFGEQVAVVNSRLSAGEKYDAFEKARRGQVSLMIGPRSALFTPFPNLGMILIDEEHEGAYISETSPRYHAVETAIARGRIEGAGVVLGSATPSMESFVHAMNREYAVFPLRHRAKAGSELPEVHVVDLRQEMQEGNKSIFSRALTEAMSDRLEKKEQIMLFLNRRGYAGFISCRSCGQAIKCPHCDVSLTSHRNGTLRCHYCGYQIPLPDRCPSCGSPYIAGFGIGTQRVESAVKKMFPEARVLRMDLDTTSKKDGHGKILSAFSSGQADILIGTQMIVKGHDFPNVTLMGILAADLSLYGDDFRSSERTFQLLTQAAGRAGRAGTKGEVFIQTYSPESYVILSAAKQDYIGFYKQEMVYRRMMHYPPAGEMMCIRISDPSEEKAARQADFLAEQIREEFRLEAPAVIGPADAAVAKVQDVYRKVIYVKHAERQVLLDIRAYAEKNAAFCQMQIDLL